MSETRTDAIATETAHPFPTTQRIEDAQRAGTGDAPPARTVHHKPTEEKVDHAVEESFPASDPVAVSITKVVHPSNPDSAAPQDSSETPGG